MNIGTIRLRIFCAQRTWKRLLQFLLRLERGCTHCSLTPQTLSLRLSYFFLRIGCEFSKCWRIRPVYSDTSVLCSSISRNVSSRCSPITMYAYQAEANMARLVCKLRQHKCEVSAKLHTRNLATPHSSVLTRTILSTCFQSTCRQHFIAHFTRTELSDKINISKPNLSLHIYCGQGRRYYRMTSLYYL